MNQGYAKDVYKKNQINTAPKKKLLIMLYDGVIKNLNLAELALNEKNLEGTNKYMIKAQDIISELMITLNFEKGGDIASNLYQLYEYMYNKLVSGNINKDVNSVIEVRQFMEELREAWIQI